MFTVPGRSRLRRGVTGVIFQLPRSAAFRGEDEMGKDGRDAERLTTTLSRARKLQLEALAEREGVSVAWLIRRAVERYLDAGEGGPHIGGGVDA